jgi:hypothetical protein
MPPVGFETTISAGGRPQTSALDRTDTGADNSIVYINNKYLKSDPEALAATEFNLIFSDRQPRKDVKFFPELLELTPSPHPEDGEGVSSRKAG